MVIQFVKRVAVFSNLAGLAVASMCVSACTGGDEAPDPAMVLKPENGLTVLSADGSSTLTLTAQAYGSDVDENGTAQPSNEPIQVTVDYGTLEAEAATLDPNLKNSLVTRWMALCSFLIRARLSNSKP